MVELNYSVERPLRVISLGAGVQSSMMALMFAEGELEPMPDCAIFADTQAEPSHIYAWIDWLTPRLPFPTYIVTRGSLKEDIYQSIVDKSRVASPPFFTKDEKGKRGMLWRQCTTEYKIAPITKKIRELMGLKFRQRAPKGVLVEQYIGISYDEAIRQKPSRVPWIKHSWPLVEREIRRHDCLTWMASRGYPAPRKSACTFCPYHDNETWYGMKMGDPEAWADAVRMDEAIRDGIRSTSAKLFIHRDLVPLTEIEWGDDLKQEDMFQDECEGMCGV